MDSENLKPIHLLTEEERIQEIAKLLAIGALRLIGKEILEREEAKKPKPIQARMEVWDLVDDEIEKQVLRYLDLNVMASTRHLKKALGIPHMTLSRRLARLRNAGFIVLSGHTRNAFYSLAMNPGNN